MTQVLHAQLSMTKKFLSVMESSKTLMVYNDRYHEESGEEDYLHGFFKLWYNCMSMFNILSFRDARKRFRVTIDTSIENAKCVHMDDRSVIKLREVESGLYLLDNKNNISSNKFIAYSYLISGKANKEKLSKRQLTRVNVARDFRKKLAYPG